MKHKILLGLTTTEDSDWRGKIKEIKKYGIKDIALFLTGIEKEEREKLYKLLDDVDIKSIFHVHLRNGMDKQEMDYLVDKYNVQAFNIHPAKDQWAFDGKIPKRYKKKIYTENVLLTPEEWEIKNFGGLCIDFAHWESYQNKNIEGYKKFSKMVNEYKVGCCHISAIKYINDVPKDFHTFTTRNDFKYLKKYIKYFPEYMSLELENSFQEQLKIKKYIEDNILK